jgi:hypothetical protein
VRVCDYIDLLEARERRGHGVGDARQRWTPDFRTMGGGVEEEVQEMDQGKEVEERIGGSGARGALASAPTSGTGRW